MWIVFEQQEILCGKKIYITYPNFIPTHQHELLMYFSPNTHTQNSS